MKKPDLKNKFIGAKDYFFYSISKALYLIGTAKITFSSLERLEMYVNSTCRQRGRVGTRAVSWQT